MGGRVEIHLSQLEDYVQLQIIDTGKGIQPEFLPYVFEHFRQEDGATTRKFGGLGLGLSIARQIVELHGGKIEVTSLGEDQGSTFTVRLPLLQNASSVEDVAEPILIQSDPLPLVGLRVLVVDDETDSRELVAFVIEQAGAEVTAVRSAIAALHHLTNTPVDLILSDIGMPEMDGYALIRQIRQLPNGSRLPAIALTAYAGEVDQQQAIAAGFEQHLAKPVDPAELVSVICSLCR